MLKSLKKALKKDGISDIIYDEESLNPTIANEEPTQELYQVSHF